MFDNTEIKISDIQAKQIAKEICFDCRAYAKAHEKEYEIFLCSIKKQSVFHGLHREKTMNGKEELP